MKLAEVDVVKGCPPVLGSELVLTVAVSATGSSWIAEIVPVAVGEPAPEFGYGGYAGLAVELSVDRNGEEATTYSLPARFIRSNPVVLYRSVLLVSEVSTTGAAGLVISTAVIEFTPLPET